jgi:hypothetical protein
LFPHLLAGLGEAVLKGALKANTSKARTHSVFRLGCMLYELIPNMPEHRLLLMQRFAEMLARSGLSFGLLPKTK